MADEATNRAAFREQAAFCARLGSPVTARLCAGIADALTRDTATGRRVLDWPGAPIADALPLRLAGGLHALAQAGEDAGLARLLAGEVTDSITVAAIVGQALARHDAALSPWLDSPPQTNEPGRAGVLMLGLMAVARRFGLPIELLEIGSSAGLNLLIDRYGFDLGGVRIGPADALVRITPEWRGAAPALAEVRFASVRGVDVQPIDATDPAAAARLKAYVWADDAARARRLGEAIEMLRDQPVALEQGDAADWAAARLARPHDDGIARVLMHSVVWQYLGAARQARIAAALEAAGDAATERRPLGWVRMEADRDLARHELRVRMWPDGQDRLIAIAQAHGAWVEPA